MKKKKVFLVILIIAWLCVIWGHSLQPAVVSEQESGKFLEVLAKIMPVIFNTDAGMFIVRKSAHFTEYAILGLLLSMLFNQYLRGGIRRFTEPVATGFFVAFIDETIQLFVVGRSGEIRDLWIDLAGTALGVLIVLAIVNNKKGKKRY